MAGMVIGVTVREPPEGAARTRRRSVPPRRFTL